MDVCCDILVPRLRSAVASDDGVVRLGADVELRRRPIPEHITARLPETLRAGLESYSVGGKGLDLLASEVNGEAGGRETGAIEALLRAELSGEGPWVFVFEWRCDEIDHVGPIAGVDELLATLREKLLWSTRSKGFIAYHAG